MESTLLPHGSVDVLGLVFSEKTTGKKLAYYTDCKILTEDAYKLANEVDILIIDGRGPSHIPLLMNKERLLVHIK